MALPCTIYFSKAPTWESYSKPPHQQFTISNLDKKPKNQKQEYSSTHLLMTITLFKFYLLVFVLEIVNSHPGSVFLTTINPRLPFFISTHNNPIIFVPMYSLLPTIDKCAVPINLLNCKNQISMFSHTTLTFVPLNLISTHFGWIVCAQILFHSSNTSWPLQKFYHTLQAPLVLVLW